MFSGGVRLGNVKEAIEVAAVQDLVLLCPEANGM